VIGRKAFLTWMAVGLLGAWRVCAQPAGRIFRIGLLVPDTGPTPGRREATENLLAGLRDLGWIEGKNLALMNRANPANGFLDRVTELALRSRVPSIYGGRNYVAAGGLMSYLSAYQWHWRSAAGFVDKILRGARPGELPVEQPTKFELIINLNTAKALGLTIPQSLLQRADEVIQ
jgi:hypothetical protein